MGARVERSANPDDKLLQGMGVVQILTIKWVQGMSVVQFGKLSSSQNRCKKVGIESILFYHLTKYCYICEQNDNAYD